MKRLLLFFAVATMLASCTLNDTKDTNVVNLTVRAADWVRHTDIDGLNLYYSYTFDMPEITHDVFANGSVQTYYVIYNAQNVPYVQEVLPYVRHFENNKGALWTRTVDCEYSVGSMTIFVTNSDFLDEIPPLMDFRVVTQ